LILVAPLVLQSTSPGRSTFLRWAFTEFFKTGLRCDVRPSRQYRRVAIKWRPRHDDLRTTLRRRDDLAGHVLRDAPHQRHELASDRGPEAVPPRCGAKLPVVVASSLNKESETPLRVRQCRLGRDGLKRQDSFAQRTPCYRTSYPGPTRRIADDVGTDARVARRQKPIAHRITTGRCELIVGALRRERLEDAGAIRVKSLELAVCSRDPQKTRS
jgi:hypothetical protein